MVFTFLIVGFHSMLCRWFFLGLFLLIAGAVTGCSRGGDTPKAGPVVKGKLTLNGQPFKDPGVLGRMEIQLWKADAAIGTAPTIDGVYNYADGTYKVGEGTNGIRPGKYKVSVKYWQTFDMEAPDSFNGAYGPETTTIIREVTADGTDLEPIDIKQ